MANSTSYQGFRSSISILVVLGSLAAAGCVLPGTTSAEEEAVIGVLRAALSGDAEVPGPGDPDGSGAARLRSSLIDESLCVSLRVENLGSVGAVHLHWASIGIRGPVILDLNFRTILPAPCGGPAGAEGAERCEWPVQEFSRCVAVAPEFLKAIHDSPDEYYVSVHTPEFPDGAVRGQIEAE